MSVAAPRTLDGTCAHYIPIWPGIIAATLVGLVYLSAASGGSFHFRLSPYPHHVLIADAWLHGQLHVRDEVIDALNAQFYRDQRASLERTLASRGMQLSEAQWEHVRSSLVPPAVPDWSVVNGKRYGYWGPMVAFLLLPYVGMAGLHASDTLFSCLIGTGTVLLMFLTLRRANRVGWIRSSTAACVALTLLFGLGTVHFYLAVIGNVWFLSQIVATFFVTLAVYCVLHHHQHSGWSVAAGAAFAAGMLARNSIIATAPFFFLALCASPQRATPLPWRGTWARALGFSLPVLLAVGVTLAFNYARFGDAFESGAGLQLRTGAHMSFRQDYLQHGLFSLHYLSRNIYFYVFNPLVVRHPLTGDLTFDPNGNSMFLVTPALLYVFRSQRHRNWFTVCLWAGAGSCLMMLLLFMGTGWYQFGNRYLLDLMPLAILLIATGMEGRLTFMSAILIILSIVANAWGTYRFCAGTF
jgi:hypothetical protein